MPDTTHKGLLFKASQLALMKFLWKIIYVEKFFYNVECTSHWLASEWDILSTRLPEIAYPGRYKEVDLEAFMDC
jgi:hypothetical protein